MNGLRKGVQYTRRCCGLVSSALRFWSLRLRQKCFANWTRFISDRREFRLQCKQAQVLFEQKRIDNCLHAFCAGSRFARVRGPKGLYALQQNIIDPQLEVVRLEERLKSLRNGPTREFLAVVKQINQLRSRELL
jgi:hypothetical protein